MSTDKPEIETTSAVVVPVDGTEDESAAGEGDVSALATDDDDDDDDQPDLSRLLGPNAGEDSAGDDEDEDEDADVGILEIFHLKCLKCSALCSMLAEVDPKPHKKQCHFSKGNERCPAAAAKIELHVNTEAPVRAFLRAERLGEHGTLSKLYALLATKSEYEQLRIKEALTKARHAAALK